MKRIHVVIILPKNYGGKVWYKLSRSLIVNGIEIPKGFIFDGATVPRLLWPIFPPVDKYLPAVALHDYLLSKKEPWDICNKNLFEALKETKINPLRYAAIKVAVSLYAFIMKIVYKEK